MVAEPRAEGGQAADAVAEDGHIDEDAGDVRFRRDGVFEGKDGAASLGRENGTDAFGTVLEVAFVGGVGGHLDDVDLPFAGGGVAEPEVPLQATLRRVGEVAERQAARREGRGDGKTVGGVERGGVNVEVDVEVAQEKPRGEGADEANLGAAGLPAFAQARGAEKGVRGLGGTPGADD